MKSVPRRRSEASQAASTCLRLKPDRFLPLSTGKKTLVAITTSWREAISPSSLPVISSLAAARVHVGRVEEVDAELEGGLEVLAGHGLVLHPGAPGGIAVGHAAEGEARDLEAGAAEVRVLHCAPPSTRSRKARMSSTSSRHSEWPIG